MWYVHASVTASLRFYSLLVPAVMARAFLFDLVWAFAFPKLPGNLLATCLHCLSGTLRECKYCSPGTYLYPQSLLCVALHSLPLPFSLLSFVLWGTNPARRLLGSAGICVLGSPLPPSGYRSSTPLAGPRVCAVGVILRLDFSYSLADRRSGAGRL